MATIRDRYILELDTSGATRALNSFKLAIGGIISAAAIKEILQLTARFEDLRTSLNTVTESAAAGGRAFDFIKQFATETQFGVEQLTQTYIQLRAAGIEPTERLLRTFADAAAVTTDQVGTLEAATALLARTTGGGLGLEELERLADRGIPVYRILAEEVGVTRQEISEFGQTADGARELVEGLLRGIEREFGGATAARLDNLSTLMSNLGIAVQNVAVAFGEGVSPAVKEVVRDLTEFLNNNQDLATALGQISGEVIKGLAAAVKGLAESLDLVTGEGLKNLFADLIVGLGEFIIAFQQIVSNVVAGFAQIAAAIAQFQGVEIFPAGTNIDQTLSNLKAYRTELQLTIEDQGVLERARNFSPLRNLLGSAGVIDQSPVQQLQIVEDMINSIESGDYFVELESGLNASGDAADSLGQRIVAIGEGLRASSAAAEVYPDAILRMVEAQQRAAEASGAIVQSAGESAAAAVTPAMEYFNTLVEGSTASVQEIEFARQAVEGLNEQLRFGIISPEVYKEAMERLNRVLADNSEESREAARAQEELNRMRAQATALVEDYNVTLQQGTADARRELEQLNMNPFERQLDDISYKLERDLFEQIQTLRDLRTDENAAEIDTQIQNITRATREAIEEQQRLARESYATQRSFAYGWKEAFDEYSSAATNAANNARDVFSVTTRGLEDLIVNFAKTGKFEIGDLAEEITETLLRQNVRAALAGALQTGGTAREFAEQMSGAFGRIPGADAVNVDQLASTLQPVFDIMRQSGAAGAAIADVRGQSISDALYVRIVNPEFLNSISNSTLGDRLTSLREEGVFGNDNTSNRTEYVTYNINAVDARSFKSLVAQDPEFIHAVAERGRRSTPIRRPR